MTKRELTADNRQFAINGQAKFALDGEGQAAKRKFSGIAYSGDVISNHWYWGNVVFELASITVPEKMPALIDHDRGCRAGYVTASRIEADGLRMDGTLLSNEHGKSVASDSDEGFPWQMSVHIDPGRVEEIMPGVKATINGKEHTGPLCVFKDSVLREVSFTATGWDSKTTATAMSRPSGGSPSQPSTGDFSMTPEQIAALQADNARLKAESEANATAAAAAKEQAEKFAKERRTTDIKALFAKTGREFKEDDADVLAFAKMDQTAFDMTARMLGEAADKAKTTTTVPAGLFAHQATQGRSNEQTTVANPLAADAKKRAEQFAQAQKGHTQFQR